MGGQPGLEGIQRHAKGEARARFQPGYLPQPLAADRADPPAYRLPNDSTSSVTVRNMVAVGWTFLVGRYSNCFPIPMANQRCTTLVRVRSSTGSANPRKVSLIFPASASVFVVMFSSQLDRFASASVSQTRSALPARVAQAVLRRVASAKAASAGGGLRPVGVSLSRLRLQRRSHHCYEPF